MSGMETSTTTETVSGVFIDLLNPKPEDLKIDDIAWALSRQSRYAGHTMCRIPYTVAQHTVTVSHYVEQALTPDTELNAVFGKYAADKLHAALLAQDQSKDEKTTAEVEKWMAVTETLERRVSEEWRRIYAFHGLMHDFAEGYLVDLPTPVKRLPGVYEAYKAHELRMDALIYETFGLPYSPEKWRINWEFGSTVVGWADMFALAVESFHFMRSRGLNWNIPLDRPSLSILYGFRWPVPNEQAYEELLARFEELKPIEFLD